MGMIDLSLCKVERADSSFAATLFSEPGNGARLQQHVIDEIEPRRCVFRLGNGQQELDQFLRNPPAELRGYSSFDYMSLVLRKEDGDGKKWYVQAFIGTWAIGSESADNFHRTDLLSMGDLRLTPEGNGF